ncbi:radical S-adenosyl methionine domain-containing protein 1, mitochondrial isoform X3 [Tachysurus fulvidraco]|uniref:radical S-adenosyl methionine domain-containing protein 1, mitochondrial isoform X3 n=1 Tax=Tachysurus fulvidraco TaxID=1234273 RepID=UPI000F4E8E7E|nr:radical S-adenosyl methionine domain-containing protein 1, mitochondrial isoform X3 [Tachysurus fulvidraco]
MISSVFFGGGTPSLAQASTVAAVLETVSAHTRLCDHAEVTLEVNPASAGRTALPDFLSAGVNRFSVGVQSLNDASLRVLGRDHDPVQALQTLAEARSLCPGRVSVDIMFGIPGQSVESWESELEEVLRVCDDHVSLYQLTLERGTHLYKQVQLGEVSMPADDVTASMYQSARKILEQAGFLQYEVSNFARQNAVSTHNLGYWRAQPYIGVGPGRKDRKERKGKERKGKERRMDGRTDGQTERKLGRKGRTERKDRMKGAHGRFVPRALGMAHREARTQTLEPDVWIKEVRQHGHATRRRIPLNQLSLLEEVLVMGLRMTEGISHQHWAAFSPETDLHQVLGASADVQDLQQRGVLILDDRGLRCSWEGLALLDSILPVLLLELDTFFHTHRPEDGQREQ